MKPFFKKKQFFCDFAFYEVKRVNKLKHSTYEMTVC